MESGAPPIAYEIVSPRGVIATGRCDQLIAPAIFGEIGILKNHAPYLATLGTGAVRLTEGGEIRRVFVSHGFMEVLENKVIILAESGERAEEIDVERAEKARERAQRRLTSKERGEGDRPLDVLRIRRALERAEARLKAAAAARAEAR